LGEVAKLLFQKIGQPLETRATDDTEVMGVEAVLSICYRRSIFTRFHAQLSHDAMFESMSDCRVALQKEIVFVRPAAAQQLVAGIIAELDLIERVRQDKFTWHGLGTMGMVDGAKLRIMAALRSLAQIASIPFELPTSVIEDVFWTREDADAVPGG